MTLNENRGPEERALGRVMILAYKLERDRPTDQESALWYQLKEALHQFEVERNR